MEATDFTGAARGVVLSRCSTDGRLGKRLEKPVLSSRFLILCLWSEEKNQEMGSGVSHAGSNSEHPRPAGAGLNRRRRAGIRRIISSIFACGASSLRQMEDEILMSNSSEDGAHRKCSSFSLGTSVRQSSIRSVRTVADEPGPSHDNDDDDSSETASSSKPKFGNISKPMNEEDTEDSHPCRRSSFDEISVENNCSEEFELCTSDSASSFVSELPVDLRAEISHEQTPLHLNMERTRRRSTRLFWDAFTRHSRSRRDSDHFRNRDRWIFGSSGRFSDEESGGVVSPWNARSEVWERIHESLDHRPNEEHVDDPCEEISRLASISRIIMLAEALFEVLDQIHQQPMPFSSYTVPHPAPASVVDSLPLKTYRKQHSKEAQEDVPQCYICLAEYEPGDRIRVLPCHHEYHMFCVDKWLKEIHGVCPLCRSDVREISTGSSTSSSEFLF